MTKERPSGLAGIARPGAKRTSSSYNTDRHGRVAEIRLHFFLDLADSSVGHL